MTKKNIVYLLGAGVNWHSWYIIILLFFTNKFWRGITSYRDQQRKKKL